MKFYGGNLVPIILLYFIVGFSYLWSYIQPDDGYIQPKHVDKVLFGVRGGVVVKALRYKPAGRGFDSRILSLVFFIDIILSVALWPWCQISL